MFDQNAVVLVEGMLLATSSSRVPPRACRSAASGSACRKNAATAYRPPHARGDSQPHAVSQACAAICVRLRRHAPNGRLPSGMLATEHRPECALEACSTCRIADARKRHASRRWKSGGARIPRRVPPSAFECPRSSSNVSCRLAHVVRVSSYALRRRQESDAEADFRRAAPAPASR